MDLERVIKTQDDLALPGREPDWAIVEAVVYVRSQVEMGVALEEIVIELHARGLTLVESIRAIRDGTAMDLGKAKDLVSAQEIWSGVVRAAEPLHAELVAASEVPTLEPESALSRALEDEALSEDVIQSALQAAVRLGKERAIRMLVGKGAKVDWRHESTGWTLLHTAVEHGMASSIRELVQLGADINAADLEGATPLHLAIDVEADAVEQTGREPDWNIVELLLGLGADTAIQDKHGKTAADWAATTGMVGPPLA